MKKFLSAFLIAGGLIASLPPVSAKIASNDPAPQAAQKNRSPEEIIKQFTTKESELFEIWKEYSYTQESKLQALGPANTVSGEFYQVSEFVFNDSGTRSERIIKAPVSTLDQAGLTMTQEDKNAFVNLQPFALRSEDIINYQIKLLRKEKVDELNCYVFEVIPKAMLNPRELEQLRKQKIEGKFFQGQIWVDEDDLQIVKTAGKTVPEFGQRFPRFETYRENIDGRYWFPTYTFSDDTLQFPKGGSIHIKMVVKYKNYRRFQSDVKLLGVEEIKDETAKPEAKGKPGETKPDVKKDEPKKEDSKTKPARPRP